MTEPLTQIEKESILTLSLMAAFADGGKSDVERVELKHIAEKFPESDVNLATLYHRVLLRQVSTTQAAQVLTNAEARQPAYEMTVSVCEADNVLNDPEKQFLAELRTEPRLNTAETARIEQQADTLAVWNSITELPALGNFEKSYRAVLENNLRQFAGAPPEANAIVSVCPGKTDGHGIAEYCRNVDADFVILGSKGQTNLNYVLLGSTVERLLKEIPCSVLVVRPPVPADR